MPIAAGRKRGRNVGDDPVDAGYREQPGVDLAVDRPATDPGTAAVRRLHHRVVGEKLEVFDRHTRTGGDELVPVLH